ncbi:uncharacterized protein MELLADRAFT_103411 [Melampsora larici-populina 98AG31]|uniref:Uncharacterized protein n=1 Tax=Melampsora larici-populina (strain 98AG31 / pathotype 3-4-7) TaxID=747676 RepID=F4RBD8_MELLP|nr:uncharacterized protein MELLADRAFT_103411 [Melampsora larici-populina 98AG31]EGG10377.1 hypothetical protein MELLADRAFT_103411 [Melampsora larici-populina 98AG31]
MPHNHSHSTSNSPNLHQLTHHQYTSLPQPHFSPSRQNFLDSAMVYSDQRKGSRVPYNNLPRYPPILETMSLDHFPVQEIKTSTSRLPSLPPPKKDLLKTSSITTLAEDYVPLNSIGTLRSFNTSTKLDENRSNTLPTLTSYPESSSAQSFSSKKPFRQLTPTPLHLMSVPSIEPKPLIKRFHLPTSSDHFPKSPISAFYEPKMLTLQTDPITLPTSSLVHESELILRPCTSFEKTFQRDQSLRNTDLINQTHSQESIGFVYDPTSLVSNFTDEETFYHAQLTKEHKDLIRFRICRFRNRSSCVSKLEKLPGRFGKLFKVDD